MVIGAGPIVIGQACEFDYSGTQACKALKEEGYTVILVNSNPATIMTDPEFADKTYIEPIKPNILEKIIAKERPDAILPTVGGQTALNATVAIAEAGILEKYNVELIGANFESIQKAEDRLLFKQAMENIGLDMPISKEVYSIDQALEFASTMQYPIIIRPAFTLGGTGGGIAYNQEDLVNITSKGLDASSINQVLLEESVLGWKEIELEVMRDLHDNVVIICSIENLDPMGVHTGDSITVAPVQTLTDNQYQKLRDAAIAVIREIGVDTGGSNVQFAMDPNSDRIVIIEMNPRVSRSSALASKATGFPIAKIAAKLAVGYSLDEIPNDITKETPASFEPTIDYVVTKIPRFDFAKFPDADDTLNTQMKSVGEAMAIGRTFKESMQKALRSLEIQDVVCKDDLIDIKLAKPNSERIFYILHAFRKGASIDTIHQLTSIDLWFLNQLQEMVQEEKEPKKELRDQKLVYKKVDTCGAEFEAKTPYLYSAIDVEDESEPTSNKKIMIMGGGPNRIGQGIEFDYCCVHASFALKEEGYETIMVNSNPETVSTDYDTSDRLYFEPLTFDDVMNIVNNEKPAGVIVQFGGQTPLKLALALEKAGVPIIGTSPYSIDMAEDRKKFGALIEELSIKQPYNGTATSMEEAVQTAEKVGFPVLVRPSYVLGGRAMEIVYDMDSLQHYMRTAVDASPEHPVLIDRFLENAIEVDVDAVSDGEDVVIAGIMEHIEQAGIHSGDSCAVLPTYSLSEDIVSRIKTQTYELARALEVKGLMNIQFAVKGDDIYVLEVNPRASRTVPFVSKATGIPWAKVAARIMVGITIKQQKIKELVPKHFSVKEVVFPFNKFPGQDTLLGPEMRSTGEVMGISDNLGMAFAKAEVSAGESIPLSGTVFISINDRTKTDEAVWFAKQLSDLGFELICTQGTAKFLQSKGLDVRQVYKIRHGHPNIVDAIKNHEIAMVVNTPSGKGARVDDFYIRQAALRHQVFCITTIAGAIAATKAIKSLKEKEMDVKAIQEYY